jgi:hypothetical protein
MEAIAKGIAFLNTKLEHLSASDRILLSKEAKDHILKIHELYKESKEACLIKLMKAITIKKREIEKLLIN